MFFLRKYIIIYITSLFFLFSSSEGKKTILTNKKIKKEIINTIIETKNISP